MNKRLSRDLLNRSCGWITEHQNAANLDVPDDLLHQWLYSSDKEDLEPTGFYLAVFSFGYLQHHLNSTGAKTGTAHSISTSKLLELFQAWQMKLALVEVHRVTHLRVRPMPLFAFPADEKLEAWSDAPTEAFGSAPT